VNCPFETCPIGTAFDSQCLAAPIKAMGFTALSKLSNFVSPASVPKDLRPFTVHPDYVSTCMYWLPKPANAGLNAVNTEKYASHLPDFGTIQFDFIGGAVRGTDVLGGFVPPVRIPDPSGSIAYCAEQVADEATLEKTKAAILAALGQKDLSIISVTCGKMNVLVTGPKAQLDAAAEKAKNPRFCFFAATKQVCTVEPDPLPYVPPPLMAPGPAPGPGGAPGPSPFGPMFNLGAPAPAPFAFLPVFQPAAPVPAFGVPVFPMAMAPAAGGPAGGPAPLR